MSGGGGGGTGRAGTGGASGPASGAGRAGGAGDAGIAVVVGATGALGGPIAARLQKAGLTVVAVARTPPSAGFVPCAGDIASDEVVDAIRATLADLDGPVRMVVQAAGLPAAGPVEEIVPDALGAAVALKVGGLLRLVRAVDDRLVAGSRIVALGGHYGIEPAPYAPAAGVTNAGLANLVRQLAHVYGPRGVTVHLVAPGPADTPRLRGLLARAAAARGVDVATVLAERAAESPLRRFVTPEQVAWAVALLLDPEADALHGSTLGLDMGARRGLF
ncbi:SDR family NAD(P)-dependent oxidoreductase [Pseudonocardia sp.]|uniref:SDR family NAD(P)-dependent oxidoreductase n=1 Tax=Pseudonocardia sp. TaxID=60912 RepID=UPI003D142BA7